jgi:hypothetical protein
MRRAMFATLAALVPRSVLACPVCFGQSDSPLALGINYGILAMIGFIGSVLLAFAGFFIYLMRRAHLADQTSPWQPSGDGSPAPEGGASRLAETQPLRQVSHPQEGTV